MRRTLIVIAALLGCVVNTMLVPWHGALMAARTAVLAELASAEICHSGTGASAEQEPTQVPAPGQSDEQCPVCKAIGAVHLAVLVAAEFGLLAPPVALFEEPQNVAGEAIAAITPRSRGPPTLA